VNVQEDDTPSGLPPHDPERDVLAERRARRGEPVGDPILIRRAETAEATAHALEQRLSGIQTRLQEAERESRDASQRLVEREQELTRASERLSDGEQQLRSISTRLADRERELHTVSERLGDRERDLRTVSDRLAEREQQLQRAELEIRGRVDALEQRVGEVQDDLVREREARQAAEGELEALRSAQAAVQPLIGDLRQIAHRLRLAAESGELAGVAGAIQASAVPPVPQESIAAAAAAFATPENEPAQPGAPLDAGSAQMADALAAAIQRLRARVADVAAAGAAQQEPLGPSPQAGAPQAGAPQVGASEDAAAGEAAEVEAGVEAAGVEAARVEAGVEAAGAAGAEPAPAAAAEDVPPGVAYTPLPVLERAQPRAWLAPAIRRVAERRDPRLAAELVLELLPAQALSIEKPLRYLVKILELGAYEVSLADGRGTVRDLAGAGLVDSRTFMLEGSAVAFAEIAGGGSRLSAWRPPTGLRVRGGRRRAKRLLSTRSEPLSLADLERAGVTVWPGLLLLALAEAVDPAATAGHVFTVAFAIEGRQSAVLHVHASGGRPLTVTRGPAQEGEQSAPTGAGGTVQSTVRLSEQGFARLIGARDLDGEKVILEGEQAPLETLLSWTDKVQGIRRFGA
jgi:hypothetical protein